MEVVHRDVVDGKESKTECAIILHVFSLTTPMHRHILFEFTNKSAKKLVD